MIQSLGEHENNGSLLVMMERFEYVLSPTVFMRGGESRFVNTLAKVTSFLLLRSLLHSGAFFTP
jgi:hypothetical protein